MFVCLYLLFFVRRFPGRRDGTCERQAAVQYCEQSIPQTSRLFGDPQHKIQRNIDQIRGVVPRPSKERCCVSPHASHRDADDELLSSMTRLNDLSAHGQARETKALPSLRYIVADTLICILLSHSTRSRDKPS